MADSPGRIPGLPPHLWMASYGALAPIRAQLSPQSMLTERAISPSRVNTFMGL